MSKHTKRSLSFADRLAAAGVDPILVAEARTLVVGYGSQRLTNSRLWLDNMALRKASIGLLKTAFSAGFDAGLEEAPERLIRPWLAIDAAEAFRVWALAEGVDHADQG